MREEFKYLEVWFNRKLWGNVQLGKMVKKAEECDGKLVWMSRVSGRMEVDRQG